jgi:predicted permease
MEILFTVAVPIFALIFLGYGARRWNVLPAAGVSGLNSFAYYFALPAMLFDKMSGTPAGRVLDGAYIAAYLSASALVYAGGFAATRYWLGGEKDIAAIHAMGGAYGNTGYMGLPIVLAVAGKAATVPMAVANALDAFLLIPLTMILVETPGGARGQWRNTALTSLSLLFTNPMLLGTLSGIGVSTLGVPLPGFVRAFAGLLGGAAGPCALFAIGATLAGQRVEGGLKPPILISAVKLLVHPLIAWVAMAWVFPVDPLWAAVGVLGAALPVGSTVSIIAGRFETGTRAVSTAILLSTAASVITVPIVLALLFSAQ